jgi:small GTP-binding protein
MEDTLDYDYVFKYILVGDASVGKSTLLQFYINRQFNDSNNPTMGVEFATKKLKVKDKVVKLQIWDTVSFAFIKAGQ